MQETDVPFSLKENNTSLEQATGGTVGRMAIGRRHKGLAYTFLIMVLLPFLLVVIYLYGFAKDQYASTVGFAIRHDAPAQATSNLGALSLLGGSNNDENGELLYAFITSQTMVEKVYEHFDIAVYYNSAWPYDPLFSIWSRPSVEDLLAFWPRIVKLSYDQRSRLFKLEVRAYDAQVAQKIAFLILEESQNMIDGLNMSRRREALALAQQELSLSDTKLREARAAMARFRAETQILDPFVDIASRSGVLGELHQQLSQALIELSLLSETTSGDDLRRVQLERRVQGIRDQINLERQFLVGQDTDRVGDEWARLVNYPEILSQYESLKLGLDFAQDDYFTALTLLNEERQLALRKTVFLAAYEPPTLAQAAKYPEKIRTMVIVFGFLSLIWSVIVLVYYSLRDRG